MSTNSDEQCSICMEVYNDKTVVPFVITPCGHTFCLVCLNKMDDKTKCPNCRAQIDGKIKNLAVLNLVNNAKHFQETRVVLIEANELFETFESTFKRVETIHSEIKAKFELIQQFRYNTGNDWNQKLKQPNVKVEHIKQLLVEMKKVTDDLSKYESDLSTNKKINFIPIDSVLNHAKSDANKPNNEIGRSNPVSQAVHQLPLVVNSRQLSYTTASGPKSNPNTNPIRQQPIYMTPQSPNLQLYIAIHEARQTTASSIIESKLYEILENPNEKNEAILEAIINDLSTNKKINFIPIDSVLNHAKSDANKPIDTKKENDQPNPIARVSLQKQVLENVSSQFQHI